MTYEPIYERFETMGSDGKRREVEFVRARFLAQGDRPELFFFQVNGEEPLDSRSLYIQDDELANLANELDFTE